MPLIFKLLFSVFLMLSVSIVNATPIQGFGAGTAVTSADLATSFDDIVNGTNLTLYQDGGLSFAHRSNAGCQVTLCGHQPFTGFSGGFIYSGNTGRALIISTINGDSLSGIEFNIGTGYGNTSTGGYWESYLDGVLTGSSTFNTPGFPSIFSLSDVAGFDELRIGMQFYSVPVANFTSNAIAIDNVTAQLKVADVPEPATLMLMGFGLAGLGFSYKRKKV